MNISVYELLKQKDESPYDIHVVYKDTDIWLAELPPDNPGEKPSCIVRHVEGKTEEALEWGEPKYKEIFLLGRHGYYREFGKRKGWKVEKMDITKIDRKQKKVSIDTRTFAHYKEDR